MDIFERVLQEHHIVSYYAMERGEDAHLQFIQKSFDEEPKCGEDPGHVDEVAFPEVLLVICCGKVESPKARHIALTVLTQPHVESRANYLPPIAP